MEGEAWGAGDACGGVSARLLVINTTRQSSDHVCRAAGDGKAKTAGSATAPALRAEGLSDPAPHAEGLSDAYRWRYGSSIRHNVQRTQDEGRAAASAERRAPDRQIDDGVVNGRLEPAAPRRRGVGQDSFQSFYASSIDAEYN